MMNKNKIANNQRKAIAATLAIGLLVTGTFAWQSFSQEHTNEVLESVGEPGGRLHDYFDGTNKDIFVENYTDVADGENVYARVRLREYLEYATGAGTGAGTDGLTSVANATIVRGDYEVADKPNINDDTTWDIYLFDSKAEEGKESIRTYRELVFGDTSTSSINYMPTENKDKEDKEPEVNGTYYGGGSGTNYDDYVNYEVETTGTSQTLSSEVISMSIWQQNGYEVGNYWVYDVDGWAYYAAPIEPQTATGILLDGIKRAANIDLDWYYAVSVEAQIATAGDWGLADEVGDEYKETSMYASEMSDEGLYVLNKAAGITTVENMVITNTSGDNLEVSDVQLATDGSSTYKVNMDVVYGYDDATAIAIEKEVTWSIEQTVGSAVDTSSAFDDGAFTASGAMDGCEFIITATSVLDSSKSASITVTVGSAS